ncbi:MAG: translation factor SUA5, partial [Oscillospiraceae bacterium]|nr:translation factor SUA5 [Oscillospiraceae bacterium]
VAARPGRCGDLCPEEEAAAFEGLPVIAYSAQTLFNALRRADALGLEQIFARVPEPEGMGLAVVNRLQKAAGDRQLRVES